MISKTTKYLKPVSQELSKEVSLFFDSKGIDTSKNCILGFHGTNHDLSSEDHLKNLYFTPSPFYASTYGKSMFVIVHKPKEDFRSSSTFSGFTGHDPNADIGINKLGSVYICSD